VLPEFLLTSFQTRKAVEVKSQVTATSEKIFNTIHQPFVSKKKISFWNGIGSCIVRQTLLNLTLWDLTGFFLE